MVYMVALVVVITISLCVVVAIALGVSLGVSSGSTVPSSAKPKASTGTPAPIWFATPLINFRHAEKRPASLRNHRVAPLVPGDLSTYIYDTERAYYDMYSDSMFALTWRKAGWDCLRHYEILSNGCIPLFPGLAVAPKSTMRGFPKAALLACYKRLGIDKQLRDESRPTHQKASELVKSIPVDAIEREQSLLMKVARKQSTTEALGSYMASTTGLRQDHTVLILYCSEAGLCADHNVNEIGRA